MKNKKSILAPENTRVESTNKSDVEFSENSKKMKISFKERLRKIVSNILNYPTQFLIATYIFVHSGFTMSHLFDGNFLWARYEYLGLVVSDDSVFIGFFTALFLFLVFRFYYSVKLKSILIYSLFFNFGSMLLFVLGRSIAMTG
tara:strand:+ start:97 stop:528 length:432 start_codon:yes stop_codon:yes gene_type:complete